jgi:hypothetical protein
LSVSESGTYYKITVDKPGNNNNDGQSKAIAKLTMQCGAQSVVLDTILNYMQDMTYYEIGVSKKITIENTYMKLETFKIHPPFELEGSNVTIKA